MSIRGGLVLGLASCGMLLGGGGLEHVGALERFSACEPPVAHQRGGRWRIAVASAGAVGAGAVLGLAGADGNRHWSLSARHLGLLLTGRVLRAAARDPLLSGSLLCVLIVAAFAAAVTALTRIGEDDAKPGYPRVLDDAFGRDTGTRGRAGIHRWSPSGARRPRDVPRRPPTLETGRPQDRPVARARVTPRTTR